jgi:hypothetical protein
MTEAKFSPARLTLAIASLPITVDLPDPAWAPALWERYAAFLTTDPAAWRVTLTLDPGLSDTDAAWIRHEGPRTTFRVAAYTGWIDLAGRQAQVSTPSAARAPSAVERTLAYILMQTLPRECGGLLLHASGIVLDGQGHVFTGPSGAGKTTVVALAQGCAEVLSDENVVVRPAPLTPQAWGEAALPSCGAVGRPTPPEVGGLGGPGWNLESTPLWGFSTPPELIRRVNRRAPLAALYTLAHTPDFRLDRLSPAEAALALLGTEKVATERPESAAAWLAAVERLVFRPTAELWEFLTATPNDQRRRTNDDPT